MPTTCPAAHFTGKERDAETSLDYFGARYFSAAQGRWTTPDWSEKPEPVPYAKFDDPQTLNLYAYVRNNPLSQADPDGHCCFEWANRWVDQHPRTTQAAKGVGKVILGGALVATIAGGDAPGSALGATLVLSGTLAAVNNSVSGFNDVFGAVKNTDVKKANESLESISNVPALVTTAATGDPKTGAAVGVLADAVQLGANPQEALKNTATKAEAVKTTVGVTDLVMSVVNAFQGMRQPPPPPPPPPPAPSCSVPGACKQ